MAVRRTLALAARPAAAPARTLCSSSAHRFQRAWDTFDDEAAFAPATTLEPLPQDPSASEFVRRPVERVGPKNYASALAGGPQKRVQVPASREFKQRNADKFLAEEPALPKLHVPSTWRDLHPQHLHDLRLQILRRGGRTPSDADLDRAYRPWLKRAYRERESGILTEVKAIQKEDKRREQLDLAWEWERQVAVKAGVPRTHAEQLKDAQVLGRLEARREEALRAQEEMREEEERRLAAGEPPLFPVDEPKEGEPEWKKRVRASKLKFQQGWAPPKRISREAMDLVRVLHKSDPDTYSTPNLASKFRISPEAIRRILKSKFELSPDERERRERRRQEEKRAETARRHREDDDAGALPQPTWGGDRAAERAEMEAIRDVTAADEYYDSNGKPWARRDPRLEGARGQRGGGGGNSWQGSSYFPRRNDSRPPPPSYPSNRTDTRPFAPPSYPSQRSDSSSSFVRRDSSSSFARRDSPPHPSDP